MIRPNTKSMSVRLPRFSLACAAALAAALLGVGSPARAGFTTFFGIDQANGAPTATPVNSLAARNSFVAALSGVGVENFENQTVNAFPSKLNFAGTSVTATSTQNINAGNFVTNVPTNGAYATSGTNYLITPGTGSSSMDVQLTFSTPIVGFGLYATDLRSHDDTNTSPSQPDLIKYSVTFTNNTTDTVTMTAQSASDDANLLFFGAIENNPSLLIQSLTITSTNPNPEGLPDVFGIDDLTIGQSAVPEPASLGMLALGFGAVLAGRRFSRRDRA
jgi:PEP-CTERM motif